MNELEQAVSKIEKRNKSIVHRMFLFSLILILMGGILFAVPNVELHAAGGAIAIVGIAMLAVMSI